MENEVSDVESIYHAMNPWWDDKPVECGILREVHLSRFEPAFARKQIEVIVGSRRLGKTTFMKQLVNRCLQEGVVPADILYLALDHPRLRMVPISAHLMKFRQHFGHPLDRKLFLFFDEVQESPDWEAELKSLYDNDNLKIFATGSTAALLESQGGKLTGRQVKHTMYPLTFAEFLVFKNVSPAPAEGYLFEKYFDEFLNTGGYPEYVLHPDDEYLPSLIDDIIYRDIARLHNIKRVDVLRDLLILVANAVGSRTSFNRLSKALGVSVDTVKEYLHCFASAFLTGNLTKWSTSVKDRIYAQKKIYLLDTGMKTALAGEGDRGAKVESMVYGSLLRRDISCGYYAESAREVDFVHGSFTRPEIIEVKYADRFDWQGKGFAGVKLFLRRVPRTTSVTVVTKSVENEFTEKGITVKVMPAWKYLLND